MFYLSAQTEEGRRHARGESQRGLLATEPSLLTHTELSRFDENQINDRIERSLTRTSLPKAVAGGAFFVNSKLVFHTSDISKFSFSRT